MKKYFLLFFLLLLLPLKAVFAQSDGSQNNNEMKVFRIESDEVIDHDVFAAAERVDIEGTVNGDVYAAGGQVYVGGTITGDLLVAAGQINITGDIGQNLRLVGGNVTINGNVGRNVSLAAGNVDITGEGEITGGLAAAFGNLNLTSPVGKYLKVAGGNLTVANRVGGDVEAAIGVMRLTPNAQIDGNLTYWSDNRSSLDESRVAGQVYFNRTDMPARGRVRDAVGRVGGAMSVGSFIFTFILGLVFLWLFPKFTRKTVGVLREQPMKSFLWGIATLFIFIFVFIVLAVTILGIPLALLLAFLYGFASYIFRIPVIYFAGSWLMQRFGDEEREILSLTAGLIIYWILILLPVRMLATLVVTFMGLGAAFLAFRKKQPAASATARGRKKA
ncbi:MAG: hypothetical protein UV73_C0012G0121 [Candidatus Gottesmanbacteria bacterium GW2011_GWA2_43_14]|uniref:DUF8173 domain-containing protein n=1 Tax=Candidatus Gottesmanbacteria bacterium GW2011_GWA2_43_14 TaxID=1618443 RepID=A0A0G1GAY8_9BACT|nr:MAG: hypothetical protein UV73_C0012G0121 [Candidatus Gottesmanbacteria bacterium GW2011_GWA2_43_14]